MQPAPKVGARTPHFRNVKAAYATPAGLEGGGERGGRKPSSGTPTPSHPAAPPHVITLCGIHATIVPTAILCATMGGCRRGIKGSVLVKVLVVVVVLPPTSPASGHKGDHYHGWCSQGVCPIGAAAPAAAAAPHLGSTGPWINVQGSPNPKRLLREVNKHGLPSGSAGGQGSSSTSRGCSRGGGLPQGVHCPTRTLIP